MGVRLILGRVAASEIGYSVGTGFGPAGILSP
jgi:hypothetical protein